MGLKWPSPVCPNTFREKLLMTKNTPGTAESVVTSAAPFVELIGGTLAVVETAEAVEVVASRVILHDCITTSLKASKLSM